jgi:hypothetical protein
VDLDAELDRLYGVPLDEFVNERNGLAKRLTKEGDREGAAEVKAVRKPTVGAWALNQALRRRRAEAEALLATGERLREAHEQLLAGGDAGELREAMREERALTSAIADCAEAIASEGGKSGPALRERVRATLHAASVDEEARSELETGRFLREREAVGLGAFGTSDVSGSTEAPERPKRGGDESSERSTARRRREAAGKSGRMREAAGKRGRATGGRTRGAAAGPTREERAAEVARAREQRAAEAARVEQERLADAEQVLAEAQAELEAAEGEHADALSALEAAKETLRDAEDAEREARRVMRARSREVAKQERTVERMRPKG